MKVIAEGARKEKITVVLFEESVVKLIGKPAYAVLEDVIKVSTIELSLSFVVSYGI